MRHPVPWITQYASPSLIAAITYGGHPRAEDPRWRESGAPDQETYAAWCARWCGMACLRMALLARDGVAPTLYELAVGCMEYGAYTDEPGRPQGLIYRPFAEYATGQARAAGRCDHGTGSRPADGRTGRGEAGHRLGAPGDPASHNDPPGTGGHLVLVTGHANGLVTFHNPSGHIPEAAVATLPMPVFDRFAAHRGIALHL